jgi:hypothetical protein
MVRFPKGLPARRDIPAGGDTSDFPKFRLTPQQKQKYIDSVPPPLEGRFAIVTNVGGGMRWTWQRRKTSGADADGEVVWS